MKRTALLFHRYLLPAALLAFTTLCQPAQAAEPTGNYCFQVQFILAADVPRLAALRSGLRQRVAASVLMDAPRYARNVAAAHRTMWRHWCAGRADRPSA